MKGFNIAVALGLILGTVAAFAARPSDRLLDRYQDSGLYLNVVQLDDGSIVEMSTTTVNVVLKVLVASDGTVLEPLPSAK